MGRRPAATPAQELAQIQVRLPLDLRDQLQKAARERGLSTTALASRAVAYYLERLIPVEELKLTRDSA